MNNYSENTLMQYLRNLMPPQQATTTTEQSQSSTQDSPRGSGNGVLYEINCQDDIDYIEIDKSGRMQIFICQNEKRVYTRRYNHSKQKPDYKEYIEEEETKLSQNNDTSAEMSQIAQVLELVANRLESMDKSINEIKNAEPKVIEKIVEKPVEIPVIKEVIKEIPVEVDIKPARDANGKFVKRSDK